MSMTKAIGGVIVLGAVGVGAYLLWDWFNKNGCSDIGETGCVDGYEAECVPWPSEDLPLIGLWAKSDVECDTGGCLSGATKCVNGISYVCVGGAWIAGGNACGGVTPVLCIEGATKCSAGNKVQCQDGVWTIIGNCVVSDCIGVSCISSQVLCDEEDTAYYQIACDPRDNKCQPTMYLPEASVCKNAGVASVAIDINGLASPATINPETTCGKPGSWLGDKLAKYPVMFWNISVKDAYGRKIEGARIKIVHRATSSAVGFIHPSYFNSDDWGAMTINCGEYNWNHARSYTDENGEAVIRSVVMWTPEISRIEAFDVYIIYNGKTVSTSFTVTMIGSTFGDNYWSCHGEWTGGCDIGG